MERQRAEIEAACRERWPPPDARPPACPDGARVVRSPPGHQPSRPGLARPGDIAGGPQRRAARGTAAATAARSLHRRRRRYYPLPRPPAPRPGRRPRNRRAGSPEDVTATGTGTPRLVRAGPSSVKGTRISVFLASRSAATRPASPEFSGTLQACSAVLPCSRTTSATHSVRDLLTDHTGQRAHRRWRSVARRRPAVGWLGRTAARLPLRSARIAREHRASPRRLPVVNSPSGTADPGNQRSKRCGEPLASPRFRPPYVRNHCYAAAHRAHIDETQGDSNKKARETGKDPAHGLSSQVVAGVGSNQRRLSRRFYGALPDKITFPLRPGQMALSPC